MPVSMLAGDRGLRSLFLVGIYRCQADDAKRRM